MFLIFLKVEQIREQRHSFHFHIALIKLNMKKKKRKRNIIIMTKKNLQFIPCHTLIHDDDHNTMHLINEKVFLLFIYFLYVNKYERKSTENGLKWKCRQKR